MIISIENRSRIVLLLFCILDHFVWAYGGHLEQVALFYVILSECVRILALLAFAISFFNSKLLNVSIAAIMAYSMIMIPLNFYGAYSVRHMGPTPNILWFKKESSIPIESAVFAAFFNIYFLLFAYLFAAKNISKNILNRK